MLIDIFLIIIIILLIIYIVYLQNLHYNERKGFYSKLGIDINTKTEKNKPTQVRNHIKKQMQKMEQGGE